METGSHGSDGEGVLRVLFDSMAEGVILQDARGAVSDCNRAAERILEVDRARLVQQNAHGASIVPLVRRDGSPLPDDERPAAEVFRTGKPITNRVMGLRRADGRTTWISANVVPLTTESGDGIRGSVMTFRDITERVLAEDELKKSQESFRALVSALPLGVAVSHGRVIKYANEKLAKILGYDEPRELLGLETAEVIHPRSADALRARYADMARGEHPGPGLLECMRRDGSSVLIEVSSLPTLFEEKPAILAVIRDVTESARAREAQRQSEARFRTLVDSAPVGVIETDASGRCIYVNEYWAALLGISQAAGLGFGWRDRAHPEDRCVLVSTSDAALGNGTAFALQFRYLSEQGRERFVLLHAVPLAGALSEVSGYLGIVVDLTELRNTERALARSEQSFRTLADRAPIGIGVREGPTITFANPALVNILGVETAEQVIGRSAIDAASDVARERVARRIADLARGDPIGTEVLSFQRPDGQALSVEVDSIDVEFLGRPSTLSLLRDVTELENTRRQRDAAHVALVESLRQKETLLKEIHHRVKNNLQVVASLLRLGKESIVEQRSRAAFNDAIARVHSIATVHEHLYKSHDLDRVEVASYLRDLVTEVVRAASTEQSVRANVLADGIFLSIDRCVPLGLIVNELVSNAVKHAFSGSSRVPVIVVALTSRTTEYELVVRDNGVGFTRHATGEGSLGLLLVDTLVRQIKGRSHLSQAEGTEWRIVFPPG